MLGSLTNFWTAADDQTKARFCLALLLIIVALVYGNSLVNGFTLDDVQLYIVRNPQVIEPSLRSLFAAHPVSNVFRPLTFATFALDWKVGGGIAFGFHVVNLVLHAAVTGLVFILLHILLQGIQNGRTIAFVTALLFAVHPIHTEAVTSIVGRAELLAAAFLIIAWILHLRDQELAALICFVLALMSKESAAVFLPLVLLGDYVSGKWKGSFRYLRIAGVTLLYVAVLWKVEGGRLGPVDIAILDNPLAAVPAGPRILNALRIAWKYVGLQIYPATLSADYSYNQIPLYTWRYTVLPALAAAAVIAGWVWAIRKREHGLALAGGVYLVGFAMTSNILMPIGTIMAERLAYLPSVGFCLLVALAWNWLRERQRALALGVMALVVALLGMRSVLRNRDWEDNRTLYIATVKSAPRSAKAHQNMALAYMDMGRLELARTEVETALQIYPANPQALAIYGLLESREGHYQEAGKKLEEAFYRIGRDDPSYNEIALDLAAIYAKTGHSDAALDLLNQVVAKASRYGRAWSDRALVHYQRGELAAARADAETALRLDSTNQQAQRLMRLLNTPATLVSPR